MRNKLLTALGVIIFIGFVYIGVHNIRSTNNKIKFKEIEVKSQEIKLKQLDERYQEVLDKKANTEAEKADQAEKIKQLEEEKKKLQEQLTLKLERQKQAELAKAKLSKEAKQVAGVGSAKAQGSCNTGNQYKDYIYFRESGCRTDAVNPIGCKGIGQACPASKIAHCGNDFACQDAWFSNYAVTRYGSWEAAWSFWLQHSWW